LLWPYFPHRSSDALGPQNELSKDRAVGALAACSEGGGNGGVAESGSFLLFTLHLPIPFFFWERNPLLDPSLSSYPSGHVLAQGIFQETAFEGR